MALIRPCRAAVQSAQAQDVLQELGGLDRELVRRSAPSELACHAFALQKAYSQLEGPRCHQQEKEGAEGEAAALQLVAGLKQQGVLRAFDSARQVPKRAYSLEDLRLNKIEPAKFLSPTDTTLSTVRTALQVGGRQDCCIVSL